jgi:sugar transferase EpsL
MPRILDLALSFLALLVLGPVSLFLALLIRLESKGPLLFRQERVGKNERPFLIYKLRSMRLHGYRAEELGPIKHDHPLVTRVGCFARRTKLDEVPQFLNVLAGTMSIVGPRPCLYSSLRGMTPVERRRFECLPGITGWAEINGNVELSWQEQLALDLWYVGHKSFWLDLYIIFSTLDTVVRGPVRNERALAEARRHKVELDQAYTEAAPQVGILHV